MTDPNKDRPSDERRTRRGSAAVARTLDIASVEESLERASQEFATGFDEAAIGMLLTHPSGRIIRVNGAFCELLEVDAETLLDGTWDDITHPDDIEGGREFIAAALSGRVKKMRSEKRYLRPDGTEVPVVVTSCLMADESRALFFFTQVLDVIELKASQDELRQKASLVQLLQSVAVSSNEAASVDEALEIAIELICDHMGWPVGHVYTLDDGVPTPSRIWHLRGREPFSKFRRATERDARAGKEGLPSKVVAADGPVWVEDVRRDPGFVRAEAAEAAGLAAAFAFPVRTADRIAAVMEFFSTEPSAPNAPLLEVMSHIGKLLGQKVERSAMENALRASEERMRLVIETANDAFVGMDEEGMITDWNREAHTMFGWTAAQALGRPVAETIIPERLREAHWRGLGHFLATGEGSVLNRPVELTALHRDGHEFPVELTVWSIEDEGRVRFNAFVHDIRERKAAEEALRDANRELTMWVGELEERNREMTVLNEMIEVLQSCRDSTEAHAAAARFVQKLFPEEAGALCIPTASQGLVEAVASWGGYPDGERVFGVDECWALRRGRPHIVDDPETGLICRHIGNVGTEGYVCVPLMAQGEMLGVLHLRDSPREAEQTQIAHERSKESGRQLAVSAAEQVSMTLANLRLIETRERLRLQSLRDPLTGLFNRRYLEESLDRELRRAARNQRPLGLIMLDADHFKNINDTHGHDAGDKMLRAIGDFLASKVRGEDIACRYGGEEFLLILPEAPMDVTARRAEQLWRDVVKLDVEHQGERLGPVTLSLGVAVFPEHGSSPETLLRAADSALYRAKEGGRNRVEIAR